MTEEDIIIPKQILWSKRLYNDWVLSKKQYDADRAAGIPLTKEELEFEEEYQQFITERLIELSIEEKDE